MLRSSVAAVLVSGLVVSGCSEPKEDAAPMPSPTSSSSKSAGNSRAPAEGTRLSAPEGQRWVGMNDVVVAVPKSWGTSTQACESPDGDTVAFLGWDHALLDCTEVATHGVSSLSIASVETGVIPLGRRVDLGAEVNGLRILHSGVACAGRRVCETTFLVRGSGAVFRAVGRGPAGRSLVEAIRSSVTRLPGGLSTVPFIEYGRSLKETQKQLAGAGLVAEVPDAEFPYYVTGTKPPAGTVVEEGTEVSLEIGDG